MDTDASGPVEGLLMRSRLHIRGGKRRLMQGKISAGIVTLYDALVCAMEWYAASGGVEAMPTEDIRDDKVLYKALVRSGALDGSFDYIAFGELVDRALKEDLQGVAFTPVLRGVESVMLGLGVMPFDENTLPAEDPSTF